MTIARLNDSPTMAARQETTTKETKSTTIMSTLALTEYRNNAQQVLPIRVELASPHRNAQMIEIVTTLCPFFTSTTACNANANGNSNGNSNDVMNCNNYTIQPLNGGLSNDLFVVSSTAATATALVRIHPSDDSHDDSVVQVVDRQVDNALSAWLSQQDMAPIFYGRFQNGRVEEFYPNVVPLSCHDMKVPVFGKQIATCLAQFHKLELPRTILEHPSRASTGTGTGTGSSIMGNHFDTISNWFTLALPREMNDANRQFLNMVHAEWNWLQLQLQEMPPTQTTLEFQAATFIRETVFCHMDCQSLNIMKDNDTTSDDDASLKLIDFEYAGWNPRAMDIANTFCEHCDMNNICANYQEEYPSKATQTTFLTTYLRNSNPELADQLLDDDNDKWEQVLEVLMKEIGRFTLMSHIGWTVWSILKSNNKDDESGSGIDFDYLEYARHRMQGYRLFKSWFYTN
jgi:thiamine kinase-like enzyme